MGTKYSRCESSGQTQLLSPEEWDGDESRTMCNRCGSLVKFRIRQTDRPTRARLLPHRVDGTPTR